MTRNIHPSVTRARQLVELCRAQWNTIENEAGVSQSWLYKFAGGEITNPTINTLQAVSDACEALLAPKKAA